MKLSLCILLLLTTFVTLAQTRERAFEINSNLGRGINFGNMFEAPSESAWGNPWKPEYSRQIAELGFQHVRIPIRWEPAARSSDTYPYTINPEFFTRIKQVVDSCLNNGLSAIINMHHHEALFADPDGQKARFLAQWKQISAFFKNYPDQLLFEILNEPNGNLTAEKWNIFLTDALHTIREDNPNRVVLIGTAEWGGLAGLSKLQVPEDENIILTAHYYNPFQFTHQGAEWVDGSTAWLGTKWNDTETERQVMQNEFAALKTFEEEKHIPIHIGEFGAYSKADATSRKKWSTFLPRYLETLGWSWAYWEFSAGFGIYNPSTKTYNQDLLDALLINPMPQAAFYEGTTLYSSNFANTINDWNLWLNGGAAATKQKTNNQLAVLVSNGGTQNWHIQLVKNGVQLEAGKKYRLTFKARVSAARSMTAYTGENKDPWGAYSDYNAINVSTELTDFTYIFEMKITDNDARIVFDLGTAAEDVYFESIVLESIELQEPNSSRILKKNSSRFYPNPVNAHLWVDNTEGFQTITIRNCKGQVIMSQTIKEETNEIDLSHLASGIYFVSLQNRYEIYTEKIIKK